MALELLLNMDFYIQHPRLTSFSNTDSHHPDTLFSLCLTTNSDQIFHDKSCSREEAILSEAHVASKSYEWSGFFSFNAEENGMICDLCCAYPSAAGNTEFLKGCSNFKKETIRKHAISNGHIHARDRSLSKEKLIAESQIAQSFSKINKDMQSQERKEMEAKINTAYFVAKEELPFLKLEGLLSLQRKNGVTLNNTYANKTSCAELVSFLSDSFRDDLICEVNSKKLLQFNGRWSS